MAVRLFERGGLKLARFAHCALLLTFLSSLGFPPVPIIAQETESFDHFVIEDQGYTRFFHVVREGVGDLVRSQDPHEKGSSLTQRKASRPTTTNGMTIVLYEKNLSRNPFTRRLLTRRILVHLAPDADPKSFANIPGLSSIQEVGYASHYFVFEATEERATLQLAAHLRRAPGVLSAEPVLGKKQSKKFLPNDPLLPKQWYLLNPGHERLLGAGINLTNVWARYRGKGITLAIVDDSLQLTHPDLASNIRADIDYDFRDKDDDPSPNGNDDYHGTAVAGIAAARGDNSLGLAGVAFEASLVGLRLIGGDDQTDEQNAAAILHENQIIQVSNNSWGPQDDGQTLEGPGTLMSLALETGVRKGRGGKGTIFVWPVGNGGERQDNANYDGFANSIYTIAVAALDYQGRQSYYSEPGACVLVAAPSHGETTVDPERILTTDLAGELGLNSSTSEGDLADLSYTWALGGTSASTAIISGIAGLIIEANPLLGWRDVQEILIRSAEKVDATDDDWMTNGAGFHFNHKYGAGLVNAEAAVNLTANWNILGPQTNIFLEQTNLSESILDNNTEGLARSFDFRGAPSMRVEHVVVTLTIAHSRRGDLAVTLISPNGTRSRLAERHLDTNPDYKQWKFMSLFNWGEHSQGRWGVQVSDRRSGQTGTLRSIRIDLFGVAAPSQAKPFLIPKVYAANTFTLILTGVPGGRYEIQGSADLSNWTGLIQTTITSENGSEEIALSVTGLSYRFYRAVQKLSPD